MDLEDGCFHRILNYHAFQVDNEMAESDGSLIIPRDLRNVYLPLLVSMMILCIQIRNPTNHDLERRRNNAINFQVAFSI